MPIGFKVHRPHEHVCGYISGGGTVIDDEPSCVLWIWGNAGVNCR